MTVSLLPQITGNQITEHTLHEATRHEHAPRSLLVGARLDGLRDQRHPGVEDSVFEAAKGFAKGHVTDNVEGSKIYFIIAFLSENNVQKHIGHTIIRLHTKPVTHIEGCRRVGISTNFCDEQIDVASYDSFLLEEGFLAEGVGEGAALTGVVGIVGHG